MAQLIEQPSELIYILQPNRANCHCRHLGCSMERAADEALFTQQRRAFRRSTVQEEKRLPGRSVSAIRPSRRARNGSPPMPASARPATHSARRQMTAAGRAHRATQFASSVGLPMPMADLAPAVRSASPRGARGCRRHRRSGDRGLWHSASAQVVIGRQLPPGLQVATGPPGPRGPVEPPRPFPALVLPHCAGR
jgi:hypothetical protein